MGLVSFHEGLNYWKFLATIDRNSWFVWLVSEFSDSEQFKVQKLADWNYEKFQNELGS